MLSPNDLASAERGSRILQGFPHRLYVWVRASENAPCSPFRVLERLNTLTEFRHPYVVVQVRRPRVVPPNHEALEALRVGAQKVDDEHVCAFCLEDYFRRVFNAIRERVSYHLVLDDPATILRLAESEGACDAFYEAVVVRRVEAEGVYHDVVRRGCNLCAALRAEVRGEVCRVEGVN